MIVTFFRVALLAQVYLSFITGYGSYTCFNLALHLCAMFLPDAVVHLPTLMTNTMAVSATFHSFGWLIDREFFSKMRARHGWSMAVFVLGDTVLHTLPVLAHMWLLVRRPDAYRYAVRVNPTFGIQSLFLHLAWCVVATRASGAPFILDDAYVPCGPWKWAVALYVVIASHTVVSLALLRALRS